MESTAATLGLMGSMQWSFNWLRTVPLEQIEQIAEDACDLIAHGLSNSDGEHQFGEFTLNLNGEGNPHGFNREEQNRLKQEAFFKAGTWFFNKKGFVGTSLDEVAETLNVTKGAFYYHIKNKEDLLYNCYTRSLDISQHLHAAAMEKPNGIQRLEYVCRGTFHVQNSDEGPLIRYNSITALPVPRRREILRITDESNDRFGQLMRDGIVDGSVRTVNVEVAQQLITGAMNASMDLPNWRKMDDVDHASIDFYDIFFNGLAPR